MRRAVLLPLVGFLVGLLVGFPASSLAQSPSFSTTIENEFPQFLYFRLVASVPDEVTDVTLRYRVTGAGTLARAKPESFQVIANGDIQLVVRVPTGTLGFIPVGSELVYYWELTLADGTAVVSDEASYVYLPPGKEWQSVSNDFMRVYYHGNQESTALRFLEDGKRTYQRMGKLLQTELEVVPVIAVLFANESDLEEAQPRRSEVYDAATVLCGSQVAINIIFLIDRSCGTRDRSDTLRHEFTHILTKAAGESGLGQVPSWLDEGTAVYSQTEPGDGFLDPFEIAAIRDQLIPFRTMIGGNTNPNKVGLYYGQSYQMVRFLIDTGGEAEFARLFATIKEGNRFDKAIEIVYGWTLDEFENEFRVHHGLSRKPSPAATPGREQSEATRESTPQSDGSQSTVPPNPNPGQAISTSSGGGREISKVALGFIAGAAILGLFATGVFLLSVMLGNRRQKPEATEGEGLPAAVSSVSLSRKSSLGANSPTKEPPGLESPSESKAEFDEWGPSSD
ncbi:MAG: hypothetical protein CL897_06560 [Dehalococcoidia bacterium]|nr:hypothetical protein [Dehalococcoidia bacterium]HCV00530.1 hypothetical protein [Dehalococcoidia bacterium]|tara:strand:+ start:2520 stop:4043 length:1524 start_codon:yes stop_codon:yes gene_type:complete